MCKHLCDTLRNDEDTGDECVECGQTYADTARKPPVWVPVLEVRARPTLPARASRGVRFHHFNGFRR